METWLEVVAKGCVYAATLLAVGTATSQQLLARVVGQAQAFPKSAPDNEAATRHLAAERVTSRHASQRTARTLESMLVLCAVSLVGALALRAIGHSVAAFGWTDGMTWENIRLIAIESNWGGGWQMQALAGAAFALTAVVARLRSGPLARGICLVVAAAVCVSLPRTGHAASSLSGWMLHSVHVLAAGLWVGTLLAIVCAGPGTIAASSESNRRSEDRRALQAAMLRAFAPVAMIAVTVLSLTGVVATVTYVGTTANLVGTGYGRILLAKIALVCLMLLLGAGNYRSLRATTGTSVPGTVFSEAIVGAIVIVLTTWLTETAHP